MSSKLNFGMNMISILKILNFKLLRRKRQKKEGQNKLKLKRVGLKSVIETQVACFT